MARLKGRLLLNSLISVQWRGLAVTHLGFPRLIGVLRFHRTGFGGMGLQVMNNLLLIILILLLLGGGGFYFGGPAVGGGGLGLVLLILLVVYLCGGFRGRV